MSWQTKKLSDVCEIIMGQSPPSSDYNTTGEGMPFFQGKAEFGELYPTTVKYCTAPKKIAEPEDILLSVRAPVGPTNLAPSRACIGRGLAAIRFKNRQNQKYLLHFFRHIEPWLSKTGTGSTFTAISKKDVHEIEIPLPPLSEQRRIADKLDILLAKVNKCKSRLERIPEILKRFRQSVLADACSGKLTEDWREENGASAPIECRLGDALMDIRYGTAKKCEPNTSGVAVLRIPNVIHGEISHNDLKYTQLAAKEYSTLKLQAGDVLVIRSNGSISLVGAPALVTKAEAGFAFAGYLIRLRTDASKLVPAYLNYCLQSPQIRTQYGFTARSTSGVHNINGKEIASLSVNLPSLHEQKEIVRRINSLFEHARKLEERFEKGKTAFLRISESILSKAFRGELVGQDA